MSNILKTVFVCCFLISVGAQAQSAGQTISGSFSNSAGSRSYELFVPTSHSAASGLLLVLHGCFMTDDQMAQGTLLNNQATAKNFLVVYPQQTFADNSSECWNWYLPDSQTRGTGEASILVGMTRQIMQTYGIDPTKVFVAGLSAGSAQASNLLGCYSDLFAGGLLQSGLEFAAAQSLTSAETVMSAGPTRDLDQEAQQAFQCSPAPNQRLQKILIVHGSADPYVAPVNGDRTFTSFSKINALIFKASGGSDSQILTQQLPLTDPAGKYSGKLSQTSYGGQVLVQEFMIQGMGHGWSGGQMTVPYMQPNGIDASGLIGDQLF